MKRSVSLLSIVVLLGLLAAGCGAEDLDQSAPAKPLQIEFRVDADKRPPKAVIKISGGTPGDTWRLLAAPDKTSEGETVEYEKVQINLKGEVNKVKEGKFEKGATETEVVDLFDCKYKTGDQIHFQVIAGSEKELKEGSEKVKKSQALSVTVPALLILKKVGATTTRAVIRICGGTPGDTWRLLAAPDKTSEGETVEYEKVQINLKGEVNKVKEGKFEKGATEIEVTFSFDSKAEPGDQFHFQVIAGSEKELKEGSEKVKKSQALSVTLSKIFLTASFDPKKNEVVIDVSGTPGYEFVLFLSDQKATQGEDIGNGYHYEGMGTSVELGLFNPTDLPKLTFPKAGTKQIRFSVYDHFVAPTEVFFQAITYDPADSQMVEVEESNVVSVTVKAPPPAQPAKTAPPEQPTEAATPEQPTETAPGEWKRPCVFDPNPTQPGGYTYVKEGLQILDQDHREEWGANWCGPTAAGISLGYWAENGYPHLVPDTNKNGRVDEEEKYDIIDELGQKMGTDPDKGTSDNDVVDGLEDFIRQMGSSEHFTVEVYDSDLGTVDPTFADYKRELERCEDVLVGLEWPGGGHWLVGRSVCNVQNPDGTYNADFVDPGTSRVYHTRMDPVTNKIWYGGQWVTFDIMVVVSPKTPPPAPGTCYIGFNNTKPPFNDYRVRQAFALAINRKALLDDMGWDDRQPATSFVPPGAWPDERYLYGQVGLPYNLDEAQAKLNEAGRPSVIVLGASDRALTTAEFIASMWEKNLEIEVELVIIEGRDYLGQLRADAPQAYFLCWYADYKSPYNFLGDVFRSDSANNYAQFHNPDYDALLTEAALEADEDRKLELYTEAERMLCETDAAIAPLYHYIHYPSD